MSQLDILNISSDEEGVYRLLLVSGQLSVGELQFSLQKDYNSVKQLLSGLVSKGLVREVPGVEGRYSALLPVGTVKDELIASANRVTELGEKLKQSAQQVVSDVSAQLEEKNATFKQELAGKRDQFTQSTVIVKGSIETKSNEFKETNSSNVADLGSSFEEMKNTVSTTVSQHLGTKVTEGKSMIEQTSQSMNSAVNEVSLKQSEIKDADLASLPPLDKAPVQEITEKISGLLGSVKESSETFLEATDSTYSDVTGDLTSNFNEKLDRLTTLQGEFEGVVGSTLDELNEHAKQVSEEQGNKLTELFSQVQQTLSSDQEVLKQSKFNVQDGLQGIDQFMEGTAQDIVSKSGEYISSVDQAMESSAADLSGKLAEFKSQVSENTLQTSTKVKNTFAEKTTALQQSMEEMFNSLLANAKEKINEINQELENALNESIKVSSESLNELVTGSSEAVMSRVTELKESNALNKEAISTLATQTVERVKTSNKELLEKIDVDIDKQIIKSEDNIKDFEENIKRINEQLDELYIKEQTAFNALREQQAARIKDVFIDVVASVREDVHNRANSLLEQVNAQKNDYRTKIGEMEQGIQAQIEQTRKFYLDGLTSLRDDLQSKLTKSINDLLESFTTAVGKVTEQNNSLNISLQNHLDAVKADLELMVQTSLEGFESSFGGFADKARNLGETLITNVQSEASSLIDNSAAIVQSSYDTLDEMSSQGNQAVVSALDQALKGYLTEFEESSSVVGTNAKQLANILDSIYKLQQDTQTSEIGTTHIVGTEANITHISGIISRIKSKATILVPDINMVDDESILKLPMTAQVTIISYIDEFEHRDWIEKMHGAKANITLRSLSKSGIGSALPDFIGCEREGEEILLATKDEKANTYIGIASLSEDFVKILGNIVIADYARGRSKQLQK